jgi:hypothetical protein
VHFQVDVNIHDKFAFGVNDGLDAARIVGDGASVARLSWEHLRQCRVLLSAVNQRVRMDGQADVRRLGGRADMGRYS